MIRIRKAADRGHFDHGWLDTYHSFSFGGYRDPDQMGFRALRVINEDVIGPGAGFGAHPHSDMEIVTYVLDGRLAHRDSTGGGGTIGPGELQAMTAGTGLYHSEANASETEPVHLYQIWLRPDRRGLEPGYHQRAFPAEGRRNQLRLVAGPDGEDGALTIHQDARIYLATLDDGAEVVHRPAEGRHAWLQVLRGSILADDEPLTAGDGAAISEESALTIRGDGPAEVLLFDLS